MALEKRFLRERYLKAYARGGGGGGGCLNFYVQGLERRLNPTCAGRHTHMGKGHCNLSYRRAGRAEAPHGGAGRRRGGAEAFQVSL